MAMPPPQPAWHYTCIVESLDHWRVGAIVVASIAKPLIPVCKEGTEVLPRLRTDVSHIDERDAAMIASIHNEAGTWRGHSGPN